MKYRAGFKYQLAASEFFETALRPPVPAVSDYAILLPDGLLSIKKGYAWDGPSGPTVDTKNSMRGSLAHDALYQLMREGKLPLSMREAADDEFGRILKEDGMSWLRRWFWVREVKKFAGGAAHPKNRKPILEAP